MATETITINEADRAASLREAETKAVSFFEEIVPLVKPGVSEKDLSNAIHEMGQKRHDIKTHWHKRIVRSGPNTLQPFEDNPPDRIIEAGDILVVDLGPVFERWEADFGRSYIVPGNPDAEDAADKQKLVDALEPMWYRIRDLYKANPNMSGDELYNLAKATAEKDEWVWNAWLAGHTIGELPHDRIPKDKITYYITDGNKTKMTSRDRKGRKLHWILEIHLKPKHGRYGAFYEQLLTVD